jgi:large subunit ribosomal protein L5
MDVIITTSADNSEISYELLRAMGLPIREKKALTDNNLDKEENG